jgi:hypothetical protein
MDSKPFKAAILPEEIVARFLRSLRNQFFKGRDKFFHQEKGLLMQAITYPARWLDDRAVGLSEARYTAIVTEIIRTVNAHGNLSQIRSPGRYLLHAVQEHMRHHGEDYYETAKATRNAIEDALAGIKQRGVRRADKSVDSTVPVLAETHRVLSAAKGGRKKAQKAPDQGSLF